MSVDGDGEQTAYLISLDYVGCDEMATGKDYKRFESETEIKLVRFGIDDVYVYDSSGRVFYAKGMDKDGTKYYEEIEKNGNIKIISINKEFINNKEQVKVTILIESKKDVKYVKITKDNFNENATKVGDKTYEIIIDKNGSYEVVAEDVDGEQDKENLEIRGIGSNEIPSATATVTNGTYEGGVWKVKGTTAQIRVESDIAKYMHVDKVSSEPTTWLPYAKEIERYYSEAGEKTLYIWVKDENGTLSDGPLELKILIELDKIERPHPTLENVSGEIVFTITPTNSEWSKTKEVKISFTEGRQTGGYQSLFKVGNGRWTLSTENEVDMTIKKSPTTIYSKITYKTDFQEELVAEGEITVENIDRTPPIINEFSAEEKSTYTLLKVSAIDLESGLHDTPYLLTKKEINFNSLVDVESYDWISMADLANMQITEDARYYLYVRDKANNIASASLNVGTPDTEPPTIKLEYYKNVLDYAVIRTNATDNVGVIAYGIVKDDENTEPVRWIFIKEQESVNIEYTNIKVNGTYTIWVKDRAGNTAKVPVTVRLWEFPELDATYPRDLYIKEGTTGTFEIVITKVGYPDAYEYQWQVSKDNGVTWSNISGATQRTYSLTAKYEDTNNLIRCMIIHARGNMYSAAARLEVVRITTDKPTANVTIEKEMILGGVMINNGDAATSSSTLSLEIVAVNAEEMSISETNTQGTWQRYSEKVSYTLKDTNNGTKTINVWTKDANGNISSNKVSATIQYQR